MLHMETDVIIIVKNQCEGRRSPRQSIKEIQKNQWEYLWENGGIMPLFINKNF